MDETNIEVYKNPIPNADKSIIFKTKNKVRVKIWIIFALILLILTIILSFILYTLYTNKKINTRIIDKTETVDLINNTDVEAEERNLLNVQKDPKDRLELQAEALKTKENSGLTVLYSVKTLLIKSDGSIQESKPADVSNYTNILYITDDEIKNLKVDSAAIAQSVINFLATNNIKDIEIDISFTYYSDYNNFLETISPILKENGIKLTIYLFPKWGDRINYKHYATISNNFHIYADYKRLSELVDEIKILSFDFTGEYDILAGPLTPKDWYENIIRYMIYKGIPKDKISFGINTLVHVWEYRNYEADQLLNVSTGSIEATRYSADIFNELNKVDLQELNISNEDERVYTFNMEGKKYIAVVPQQEYITELENLVLEFGITKIFYR
jgi:hypothetical protein